MTDEIVSKLIIAIISFFGVLVGSTITISYQFFSERRKDLARTKVIEVEIREAILVLETIKECCINWRKSPDETKEYHVESCKKNIAMNNFDPIFFSNLQSYSNLNPQFIRDCYRFFISFKYEVRLFSDVEICLGGSPGAHQPLPFSGRVEFDSVLSELDNDIIEGRRLLTIPMVKSILPKIISLRNPIRNADPKAIKEVVKCNVSRAIGYLPNGWRSAPQIPQGEDITCNDDQSSK